jgi:glycosyltransferase involved in cell wall biosynthesis
MLLSIITPTYNRAYCLGSIYASLVKSPLCHELEWIIVDDGSTDNTSSLVNEWRTKAEVSIRYFKVANGGKTRAVHHGFAQEPKGRFTLILDSDDYLADDTIGLIEEIGRTLPSDYVGIIGLKSNTKGEIIGDKFITPTTSYIDLYFGANAIKGDKLFIIRTEIYKQGIVLPHVNEKFMPDNVPYIFADAFGKFKTINKCLYYGDYLQDGMTANVLKTIMNNINGLVYEQRMLQNRITNFKFKVLNNVKYVHYSLIAGKSFSEIYSYSGNKLFTLLLYLPSLFFLAKKRKETLQYKTPVL